MGPKIFVSCLLRFPPQFDQSSQNSRKGDAYLKQDQRTISRPNMAWMCSASIGFNLRSCLHIVFLLDRMEWFFNWSQYCVGKSELWSNRKVLDCRWIVHWISRTPGECVEAWHMCLACPTGFGASFCRLFSANIQHWAFWQDLNQHVFRDQKYWADHPLWVLHGCGAFVWGYGACLIRGWPMV